MLLPNCAGNSNLVNAFICVLCQRLGCLYTAHLFLNYIPKHKDLDDYVREHEKDTEKNLKEYEEKKRRRNSIDDMITNLQTPIFIAILYFIFQMPVVNTLIFKKLSFLSIYNDDGNFNFYGLLLKSMLFGSLYYTMVQFTTFISEF